MVEKFVEELEQLKVDVMDMADLSIEMLRGSIKALKERDVEEAQRIIAMKVRLAELDSQIEADALRLIALYSPVAGDMRTIACVLKLITYLARIGRYGKDIAKIVLDISDEDHIARLVHLPRMADGAISMINDAIEAFKTGDASLLDDFAERDDTLDAERYSIFRECLTYMMEDPHNITRCTHYVMVARYLERCGDHACKMAEKIHYMITGVMIEIK